MRISDWSSDVCSSDLCDDNEFPGFQIQIGAAVYIAEAPLNRIATKIRRAILKFIKECLRGNAGDCGECSRSPGETISAERRVGTECVRTCRSRWSRDH